MLDTSETKTIVLKHFIKGNNTYVAADRPKKTLDRNVSKRQ